jgi:predicted nucleic acid-binding protein
VPGLWHLEVGNALLVALRKNRIDQAGIAKFLSTLNLYDIEVDSETAPVAWSSELRLAEGHGLTLYDAAYLELALRKGLPLATLDATLRKAVKQAGGALVF